MRVAFLVGPFPKLSKTFILDQISGLLKRGISVDVYAEPAPDQGKIHPDFRAHNMDSRLIYPDREAGSLAGRLMKLPALLASASRAELRTYFRTLDVTRYGTDALSLKILYETLPFKNAEPYDIVHAHFGPYGVQAQRLMELGVLEGRLVTSFHGNDMSAYISAQGGGIYDRLFSFCRLFLPVSMSWKNKLVSMGCDGGKISVHHMGVDCEKFCFSPRQGISDRALNIVSVGRFTEKKGFEYGIRAVDLLVKKGRNISYTLIGDGPLRDRLSSLVSESDAGDNIILAGWRDSDEVRDILDKSDLMLAPSLTAPDGDMEGIPMVLMEAMAAGLPVISTRHSGIPELIRDSEDGLLAPERDPFGLSERIEFLMNHPEKYRILARNGRQRVESDFNIDLQNDRLVRHYRRLMLDR